MRIMAQLTSKVAIVYRRKLIDRKAQSVVTVTTGMSRRIATEKNILRASKGLCIYVYTHDALLQHYSRVHL